ncbi:MAG: S-methyl-5'-thioadenosine phosphorylase [Pseudomonadota bacterium]|jgi:5'-methylthioadenosine phosphorylase|nr:S-methyl-5'-thioadenosine phosphorylase [Sphingomonas sp.]MDQ3471684.1 S-methyl-5'-thioadenosine phosphorylase [Pseudomonadota bacterium]
MSEWCIGVIGGSGLYSLAELEDARAVVVQTPWGPPSDEIRVGRIAGKRFAFLPRHGRAHQTAPGHLNYCANVDALKRVGATDILAISAVGSLREELAPGDFVAVDQFIDRTRGRVSSFFGEGIVVHVSMADPVCPRLSQLAAIAAEQAGAKVQRNATYLAMEGPQFSTRAESRLYRQWGCDVIGMTAMPEARLAREAELPYALVGMVTDYDCWREDCAEVEVADVLAVLKDNAARAARMLVALAAALPDKRPASPIDTGLDLAIVTPREARDPEAMAKLDVVCRRVLRAGPR